MPTRTSSSPSRTGSPGEGEPAADTRARGFVLPLAFLAMLLGLAWLAMLALQYRQGIWVSGVWVPDEPAWGFDLAAYVGAAQRLIDTGSLYATNLVTGPFQPGPIDLYYYAPPLGVAVLPLTGAPLTESADLWWLLRIGALLAACALMPVSVPLRAAAVAVVAFSLPGLKDSLLGNVSLLLLLPMVAAWRWMDRPAGSLLMAAAIAVRPNLGLFLIWQLLRRRWRAAGWTIGGGVALVVLTLPFVGLQGYEDYLAVIRNLTIPVGASEDRDLGSLLLGFGASEAAVSFARTASTVVAGAAVLLSLRRDREASYMVMLSASLLVVPLLWDHYLATLVVPAAFLAQRLWRPLLLLPLLSWLPAGAPVLVAATMLLPFLVARKTPGPGPVPMPA